MVMDKPQIVAELTINHLGKVNIAKAMIKSAKASGASLVKIKYKNVDKYYVDQSKKWRDFNFKEYRKSLELSRQDIKDLAVFCGDIGIDWFSTIHDLEGLDFIGSLDPVMYKVASADSANKTLLYKVMDTCKKESKPLVVSLGGKDLKFIKNLVKEIERREIEAVLLHTISIYPTPIGASNMDFIDVLKEYESDSIKVGYSGHEVGFGATLLAASKGVSMIERHFTLDNMLKIHHIGSSLIPSQFKLMSDLVGDIVDEKNCDLIEYAEKENDFLKRGIYQ
jgi:sialic acid synthase SpsE